MSIRRAVEDTAGEALRRCGQTADAYHARGNLRQTSNRFRAPGPSYLRGVQDDYCATMLIAIGPMNSGCATARALAVANSPTSLSRSEMRQDGRRTYQLRRTPPAGHGWGSADRQARARMERAESSRFSVSRRGSMFISKRVWSWTRPLSEQRARAGSAWQDV
jgi:hypothetical protein